MILKNILKVTFLFIGLVIGAGFASGREILEFFNLKNSVDFSGIIFAALIFSFIFYIILFKSKEYKTENFYQFTDIVSGNLGYFIKKFMFLYMFAGFFVMLSAGGSLFRYTLNIDKKTGVLIMTFFCSIILYFESRGIEILNTILVPLMIIGILYICYTKILLNTSPTFFLIEELKNNFILAAVCYVSYNTINAGVILVPYSKVLTKKSIKISAILCGIILGLLIFSVWLTQNVYFERIYLSEFPMLDIAASIGEKQKNVYSAVLFMSIFTTATSCGFGVLSAFNLNNIHKRIIVILCMCLLAFPLSCFGFSTLVAHVYSLFGYIGLFWMAILFYRFFKKS